MSVCGCRNTWQLAVTRIKGHRVCIRCCDDTFTAPVIQYNSSSVINTQDWSLLRRKK